MEAYQIIGHIQNFSPLLGIILAVGLGLFMTKEIRYALIFLLSSLLVNISIFYFHAIYVGGRYLAELFVLLILLSLVWTMYQESKKQKSLLVWGIMLSSLYWGSQLALQPSNSTPSVSSVLGPLSIIILCFRYFYYFYQREINITENISFLMICITFFYAAGGFFTKLSIEFIKANGGQFAYLWFIQSSVSIITYLAFAWLIWWVHQEIKPTKRNIIS